MEASGMLLLRRRRRRRRMKARAGEVASPKKKMNEEEEEEGDEEEEEEEEEKEEEEQKKEEEQEDKEEEEEEAKEDPKKSSEDDGKTSKESLKHNLQTQVLHLLDELEETREMVLKHEEDALELQGLLEDERLASAHQAEVFTKQIQCLQAQMHVRKDEYECLQETKEAQLGQVAEDLQEANEQIQNLRLEAEEAAAVHENEIASLQEELCRMKAELGRVQQIHDEYEMELTSLRAEIQMIQDSAPEITVAVTERPPQEPQLSSPSQEIARLQGELDIAKGQYTDLREEFLTLQASNKLMVHQLEKLEAMKYNKYRGKTDESPSLESISQWPTDRRYSLMKQPANHKGSCVSFWSVEIVGVASDYTEEERMEKVEEENELDVSRQLAEEKETVEKVQNQSYLSQCTLAEMENEDQACSQDLDFKRRHRRRRDSDVRKHDRAQRDLREMEERYRRSQYEWEQLQEELYLCREEIERLNGSIPTGGRVPNGGMKPFGMFIICAGGLMLYSCFKKFSDGGSLT